MAFLRGRSWGLILLAAWLILFGLFTLLKLSFSGAELVLPIVALVAGVLLLMER